MTINKDHLLNDIIIPVLNHLELNSLSAQNLLLGTCAQESNMGAYLRQINGPALGIYQMEPADHEDIWANYLAYKPDLVKKIREFSNGTRGVYQLVGNFNYATALCRIHYLRAPEDLPDADDLSGLAEYYKKYYNTLKGKATVEDFINNYRKYIS